MSYGWQKGKAEGSDRARHSRSRGNCACGADNAAVTQPDKPGPVATVWKLIREIPANIQKLAKLLCTGFTTRGPDGEWHQRSIEEGEGIAVTNGDGVDGDPMVALAELAGAGGGGLQKTCATTMGVWPEPARRLPTIWQRVATSITAMCGPMLGR